MAMEWPAASQIVPVPVVLNSTRPSRHRGRLNSEHPVHRPVYFQDQFGLLVPADGGGGGRHGRSSSVSGLYGTSPSVVVNNEVLQESSPSPRHRRRSSHGHDHHYSDDDDWEGHRSGRRRRGRSRGRDSRTPSPYYDSETEERLRKLKQLEKKEEDQAAQERWEEEQIVKAARKEKKKKEEDELKKRAVEEHELKKLEDAAKAKKKKEEEEEAFREKAMQTFAAAGYSKKSVANILDAAEKGNHGNQIMDLSRPTYIKVNKKYLSPETLNEYKLPWKWDERDSNYIIIKRWIPERDQDILFEHTRELRDRRLLTDTTVELKKKRDQLMLVRKRSPSRAKSKSRPTSWLLGN